MGDWGRKIKQVEKDQAATFWKWSGVFSGRNEYVFLLQRASRAERASSGPEGKPWTLGRMNPNGQPADPQRESCPCRSISSSPTNRRQRGSPSNHGRYFWCWKPATLWQAFSVKSAPFQRWEEGGKPSAFCTELCLPVCVCIYLGCLECDGGWAWDTAWPENRWSEVRGSHLLVLRCQRVTLGGIDGL